MNNLEIEETKTTPKAEFRTSGEFLLEGVSLPEDSFAFYSPIFKWLNEMTIKNVVFNIKLEYLNTSSTKQIFMLLKKLTDGEKYEKVEVNWYYEEDDEDMHEAGEYYSSLLTELEFRFIAYAEVI